MRKDWLWFLLLVPMVIIILAMEYMEFLVRSQILGRWYVWMYLFYTIVLIVFFFWWYREYRRHKEED